MRASTSATTAIASSGAGAWIARARAPSTWISSWRSCATRRAGWQARGGRRAHARPGRRLHGRSARSPATPRAGGRLGLVYLDSHADLNVPASVLPGTLDWMGMAHMLGDEGAGRRAGRGRPAHAAARPDQVVLLGWNPEVAQQRERDAIERSASRPCRARRCGPTPWAPPRGRSPTSRVTPTGSSCTSTSTSWTSPTRRSRRNPGPQRGRRLRRRHPGAARAARLAAAGGAHGDRAQPAPRRGGRGRDRAPRGRPGGRTGRRRGLARDRAQLAALVAVAAQELGDLRRGQRAGEVEALGQRAAPRSRGSGAGPRTPRPSATESIPIASASWTIAVTIRGRLRRCAARRA